MGTFVRWWMFAAVGVVSACACGDDRVCRVDGGAYYAVSPDGWNGRTPLPVILTAHGYNGSAQGILARDSLAEAYGRAGALWVVPEGEDGSWATRGSPETLDASHRDDVAFLETVLEDAASRWPVDRNRVAASGFSQGGSMASELGCQDPERWPIIMPVSGTFWEDVPSVCAGPVSVRHTHGRSDGTWPLDGRPLSTYQQGSVWDAMDAWTATAACQDEPTVEDADGRACSVFRDCQGGDVRICLHDGGHVFPDEEAALQVEWLASLGWW